MSSNPLISVIIPARNEARTIASVLKSLARQDLISQAQVIVVDGNSDDGTTDASQAFPFVEVVRCEPGRSLQMNRGAQAARAPILWFLHADSTIPSRAAMNAIIDCLDDAGTVGGCFRYKLRGDDLYYQFITYLVNLRTRLFRRPYGDPGDFRSQPTSSAGSAAIHPATPAKTSASCCGTAPIRGIPRAAPDSGKPAPAPGSRYGKFRTTVFHLREWLAFEFSRNNRLSPATTAAPSSGAQTPPDGKAGSQP